MYTLYNNSQSIRAVCFSLFELSILNFLHKASRLAPDPGNLSLATSKVSRVFLISILSLPAISNS